MISLVNPLRSGSSTERIKRMKSELEKLMRTILDGRGIDKSSREEDEEKDEEERDRIKMPKVIREHYKMYSKKVDDSMEKVEELANQAIRELKQVKKTHGGFWEQVHEKMEIDDDVHLKIDPDTYEVIVMGPKKRKKYRYDE